MAKKGFEKRFNKGSIEYETVNRVWELMKMSTPETKKICKMLFDAFMEFNGNIEDIREIWIEWWVIFQTYYENDDTDDYWSETFQTVNNFNEKYRDTDYNKLVLKLSIMIMDFQQWRRDGGLL